MEKCGKWRFIAGNIFIHGIFQLATIDRRVIVQPYLGIMIPETFVLIIFSVPGPKKKRGVQCSMAAEGLVQISQIQRFIGSS